MSVRDKYYVKIFKRVMGKRLGASVKVIQKK